MRLLFGFLLFLCVFTPSVGFADVVGPLPDALRKKETKDYNDGMVLLGLVRDQCLKDKVPILGQVNQDYLCSCYMNGVNQSLNSMEELKTLALKQQGWVIIKDKMMFGPYMDCIKETTKDFTRKECFNSFQKKPGFSHIYQICECVGDNFDSYFDRLGLSLMTDYLQDNPRGTNPYAEFFGGYLFRDQYQRANKQCINRHEYGWE